MLTPDQITQVRAAAGLQPLNSNGAPPPAPGSFLDSIGYQSSSTNQPSAPIVKNPPINNQPNLETPPKNGGGILGNEGQGMANDLGTKLQSNFDSAINQTTKNPDLGNAVLTGGGLAGKDVTDIVGEGVKGAMKGIASLYNGVVPQPIKDSLSKAVSDQLKTPTTQAAIAALKQGGDAYNNWKKANPENADKLENLFNIGNLALTLTGTGAFAEQAPKLPGVVSDLATGAVEKGGNIVQGAKDLATSGAQKIISKVPSVGVKSADDIALNAVTPKLSGKALIGAYTSDFAEGAKKAGLLTKQSAPISDETKNLATNLGEYLTSSKDHIGNLGRLGEGMNDTEGKLTTLLENDKTPLDKEGIVNKLDEAKANPPQEFISTNKQTGAQNLYNDVIDFMKDKVAGAEETIKGGRNARIGFDSATKEQFPSAFNKNGFIDITKPAGRAIKTARDIVNENLYATAEKGSEMQGLIGKESDIFKAVQVIGQKAAANEGKTALKIFFREHPNLGKIVRYGTAFTLGDEVAKHVLP